MEVHLSALVDKESICAIQVGYEYPFEFSTSNLGIRCGSPN
jgi:hypothetical protein